MSNTSIFAILIVSMLINNVVLSQFLGICPFLGVSKKVETAAGMGVAVIFVTTLSSIICGLLYTFLLHPMGLEYLNILVFLMIIAALVQFTELFLKKCIPSLYRAFGVYLPLITTNCAVLGAVLLSVQNEFNYFQWIINGLATSVGFAIAIIIFAGLREKMEYNRIPKAMRGMPFTMFTAALMAIAFYGFSGLR